MAKRELTKIELFNALSNAAHIFKFHQEETKFRILDVKPEEGSSRCKAVLELEDGSITGLFTDSITAKDSLLEVHSVFGDDMPLVQVKQRVTGKDKTVYYFEVQAA